MSPLPPTSSEAVLLIAVLLGALLFGALLLKRVLFKVGIGLAHRIARRRATRP